MISRYCVQWKIFTQSASYLYRDMDGNVVYYTIHAGIGIALVWK